MDSNQSSSSTKRLLSSETALLNDTPDGNSSSHDTTNTTNVTPSSNPNRIPRAVFFIIGNEICERFSFYGLKAILALYLKNQLEYDPSTATALVHAFVMVAYAMTLFGGWLSDSVLGKFTTVVALSLVYVLGSALLSITAAPAVNGGAAGAFVSLALIAIGTGGIKPVVSSFLGDQFAADQAALISRVFMYFYFAINLGSVCSTLITPSIRSHWSYAAAFGLPAILLFVATLIFIAGKRRYRRVPPAGSVVSRSLGAIFLALWRKTKSAVSSCSARRYAPLEPVEHWLDHARDRYGDVIITDLRGALRAAAIFIPLPAFWALFDQHASRFIFQASEMDLNVFGFQIEADQVPFLNPLMVLMLIPVFDFGIYPGLRRIGVNFSPLRRIGVGMLFAAAAFAAAAVLESFIDAAEQPNSVHVAWQLPQYLLLTIGEVLISITGLEFAYTQSPTSLKAFVSALWQLTVAGGNLIVILVASSKLLEQVWEYALFACLMVVSLAIFAFIARGYKYATVSAPQSDTE
jgi:POT family proton-dependent oligopeptide transporter